MDRTSDEGSKKLQDLTLPSINHNPVEALSDLRSQKREPLLKKKMRREAGSQILFNETNVTTIQDIHLHSPKSSKRTY